MARHEMTPRGKVLANLVNGIMRHESFFPLFIVGVVDHEFALIIPQGAIEGPFANLLMRAKLRAGMDKMMREHFPLEDDEERESGESTDER